MQKYLENRIKELKEADARACEKRWDMNRPANERSIWREQSNEITARRHELEYALKFLNEASTESQTLDQHEKEKKICPKCGRRIRKIDSLRYACLSWQYDWIGK